MPLITRDKTFYTVTELSEMLNVTTVTIRNYIKQGKLKGEKIMDRWLVSDEEAREFLTNCLKGWMC
jgi:excisionase family DNA binding protein